MTVSNRKLVILNFVAILYTFVKSYGLYNLKVGQVKGMTTEMKSCIFSWHERCVKGGVANFEVLTQCRNLF